MQIQRSEKMIVVQAQHNQKLMDLHMDGTVSNDNAYGTYKVKKDYDAWITLLAREMTMDDVLFTKKYKSIETYKKKCKLPKEVKILIADIEQIQEWCKEGILERGWPKLEKNHEEFEAKRKDLYQQYMALLKKRDAIKTTRKVKTKKGERYVLDPVQLKKDKPLADKCHKLFFQLDHHLKHGKKY